jgi:ClpP class serine protease
MSQSHRVRLIRHVGATELAKARASDVLALDPRVLAGGGVELQEAAPTSSATGAVGLLTIDGPIAQRAVSDLCGFVDGYDAITERFSELARSPEVSAIVVRICSPGGDVAGLEVAVSEMRRQRDASGKPVAIYVDELAASAAYWIAAALATEGIYLPEAGMVGSIGCIGALVDVTGALEQEGVKVTLVRSPAGKAESHPHGPVSALAEERTRARVEAAAGRFVAAVSAARGLEAGAVRALDGDVLGGAAAVAAGLADGVVSGLGDVVEMMAAGARRRQTMEHLRAVYGLGAEATEAEIEAAAMAMASRVRDLEEGTRTMRAQLEAAQAKAREADAMLASIAAERAQREHAERVELVGRLVKAGYETPATAWTVPGADALEPRGVLATMPIAELRERVVAFESAPRASVAQPSKAAGAGLTAEEIALCKVRGIDPARFAAVKAEMMSKAAHGAAGEV